MNLLEKLRRIKERFDLVTEQLSDSANMSDMDRIVSLSRERSELTPFVEAYERYERVCNDLIESKSIIDKNSDPELVEFAKFEIDSIKDQKEILEDEIKLLLLPKDPNDTKNAIMEVRAGTGGEEASLFAENLFRMYTRYAELKGWKYEILDYTETGLGGLKEATINFYGESVFAELKYESGVHRVQRVPATEASGRVHTSAASVAVLPEVEDVSIEINPNDLKIDVFRSGGAGGQNVNKVETAIRITHLPTGLVVQCQDERSQHKNRDKAMKVLKSRLYDLESSKQNSQIASQRKSMVGSGDRSEKIRTYNFPQNRVTDHRIGLTLYNLSDIINGDLNELIEQLKIADRTEKLRSEMN
ncbi:MAG: peptide chain release factor 1 [Ignavibacteriaceae bacterium]|nr:peptide chain release factor 1 [Ignavibacteriaceae bacterium]